jgi:8-oxo-dGTP pyrophosphatase MutT (NUDIX family)
MTSHAAAAASLQRADTLPASATRQTGAYGVIVSSSGKVLTVFAENGRCYLPGGRVEPGETPRDALIREIAEECGWSAAIVSPLRESTQSIMGGDILLNTSHWRARLLAPLGTPPEFLPHWLGVEEALSSLHREADRAALGAAVRGKPVAPALPLSAA